LRPAEIAKRTSNPTVFTRAYRTVVALLTGKCQYCGPHDGENAPRSRYGRGRNDRYKNHRRQKFCEKTV
jgi:hypothetical protein